MSNLINIATVYFRGLNETKMATDARICRFLCVRQIKHKEHLYK